jgi:hypothetical protein
MTTHTPARIPCGVIMRQPDGLENGKPVYRGDMPTCGEAFGLCPACQSKLLAHYNAPTTSDPAKHAEAVEHARRLRAAAKLLDSPEIRREAMDGYMIVFFSASIVLKSMLCNAAAFLDSLTPATGGE